MTMRRTPLIAIVLATTLAVVSACQGSPPAVVQTAATPAASPTPARAPLGVVFGQLRLPAAVVASQGGSIISTNGSGIVAQGGGNVVGNSGGTLVGNSGGTLVAAGTGQIIHTSGAGIVAQGGGNIVAQGGGNIVAQGGGNIVASSGANIVAQGGGNIVAQGGGNIVAQGGGNLVGNSGGTYRHLAQATDVIDALAIRPSGQVNPQVVPGESRPVAHAVVYLTDAEGHPLPGVPYAVTDDKGYYFFAGLPTNKPVVATVPFMPASIVAQGGGNIVAQGGGNIVAQGGGNIVAQGGGNIVAQGGGNIVAQGGGNFGLLATLETDTAKASPKVIAMPTTLDHLPTDAGNGVAAIAGRNGLDLPRPGERAVQETHDNNGDISLATTLTSNLVLAGQQGQVIEVSQAQFDLVVERVADALLSAPLSSVFQPVPEVPLLVDIRKLDLPEGTDLTFRQRDKDLVDNEAARQQAAAELAKLAGDAKQPKEAELVRLEAEAKRLAQAKIAALFDLASQLKAKLNLSVKTDNEPIGQDQTGSRGLDRPTDDPGTTDPTPAPAPAQPAAEPDGLPSDDPTPSPDVDATGAVNVTPGNVTNAGTEGVL